ncbi:MAG: helix-turn-helix transcriptional regulator [Sphingomonadaceae bacterium]|nr:helix-turn-helix transcriptional regulator [Sphingomonadaceae bacterium]
MTDLLFIQIIRSCTSIAEMQSGLFAALADKSIARALKAIHEDPSVPWTVSSLAKKAGLSRTVFAKRFHTLVGVTPIQYLTRWRLIVAEDMLLRSDLPVGEIQARLGFSSSFAFSRAFRFAFGDSPRAYRKAKGPSSKDMSNVAGRLENTTPRSS